MHMIFYDTVCLSMIIGTFFSLELISLFILIQPCLNKWSDNICIATIKYFLLFNIILFALLIVIQLSPIFSYIKRSRIEETVSVDMA